MRFAIAGIESCEREGIGVKLLLKEYEMMGAISLWSVDAPGVGADRA